MNLKSIRRKRRCWGKRTSMEKRRQTMLFQKERKRRPLEMPCTTVTLNPERKIKRVGWEKK